MFFQIYALKKSDILLYLLMIGLKSKIHRLVLPLVHYKSNGKPQNYKPFNPVEHGLPSDFVLTNYTKMKG